MKKGLFALLILFAITGCYKEQDFPVNIDISYKVEADDYSVPVRVAITNNTTGSEQYTWTFEGAEPAASTSKDPGTIVYTTPGTYKIKLAATNSSGGSDTKELEIKIDVEVKIGFTVTNTASWYPNVSLNINNTTQNSSTYSWGDI